MFHSQAQIGARLTIAMAQSTPSQKPPSLLLEAERVLYSPPQSRIHEGQVSLTHGFLPYEPLMESLPPTFQAWEDLAKALPELLAGNRVREAVKKLPLLDASNPETLSDEFLSRAAPILGNIAHAYYFNFRKGEEQHHDPLPVVLKTPWEQVTKRLGRKLPNGAQSELQATRIFYDTFFYNWKFVNPDMALDGTNNEFVQIKDIALRHSPLDMQSEATNNLSIILIDIRFGPALKQILTAINAVATHNDEQLILALRNITRILENMAMALDHFSPAEYNPNYADPSTWSKTVARFDGNIPGGSRAISGTEFPLFHTLDSFFERAEFDSFYGKVFSKKFPLMPAHIDDFISAMRRDLQKYSIREYIKHSQNLTLLNCYRNMVEAYVGETGFMSIHLMKAYGFLRINFRNGRLETNGGNRSKATLTSPGPRPLIDNFLKSMPERAGPYCVSPSVASKLSMHDFGGKATEIIFDISTTGIDFQPGDRCAILPENSTHDAKNFLDQFKLSATQVISLDAQWQHFFLAELGCVLTETALENLVQYADLKQFTSSQATVSSDNFHPLRRRLYSVSPIVDQPNQIRLTVGSHTSIDQPFQGVCSSYLVRSGKVAIRKAPARSFRLPRDKTKPVIMFAAGTGISPFVGFVDARAAQQVTGPTWLLFSTQNRETFYYQEKLLQAQREGQLTLRMIFSQDEIDTVSFNQETKETVFENKYSTKHIDALIRESANDLCDLILNQDAHIYICGSTGFVNAVKTELHKVLQSHSQFKDDDAAEEYIYRLIGTHRLSTDEFSTHVIQPAKQHYPSQVTYHNKTNDCWITINGNIYDLTKFLKIHPGGRKVLQLKAGLDASVDYNYVRHNRDQQIESMLQQYFVGKLAIPTFKTSEAEKLYQQCILVLEAAADLQNNINNNLKFFVDKPPAYLWREVIQVLMDGHLSHYFNEDNEGAFKYVFGTQLNELFTLLHSPIVNWQDLHNKCSDLGRYIQQTSLGQLTTEQMARVESLHHMILENINNLCEDIKNSILGLTTKLESSADISEAYGSSIIEELKKHITAFTGFVNHVHKALKLATAHLETIYTPPAVMCPFADSSDRRAAAAAHSEIAGRLSFVTTFSATATKQPGNQPLENFINRKTY